MATATATRKPYFIEIVFFALLAVWGVYGMTEIARDPETSTAEEPEKVIIHVPRPEPTLEDLLETIPAKFGVERAAVEAVLEKEDAERRREAKRCEWKSKDWLRRASAITKDPEQRDAYRCSYGPMQVAGWLAHEYGMTWVDALDLENNIELGTLRLAQGLEIAKEKSFYDRYWFAFRRYNGSGPKARKYADEVLAIFKRKMESQEM